MNDPRATEFESALQNCIDPIAASAGRKRAMREEMLAHLLSSYDQELRRQPDERAAMDAAIRRMGGPEDLRRQLQASVPLPEHFLILVVNRKETGMLLPIIGIVLWSFGAFSNQQQVEAGGVVVFCASVLWQMFQKDNFVSRRLGRNSPWMVGILGVAFGAAVIMPALAKIKRDAAMTATVAEFLAIGVLITLGSLLLIGNAVWSRRARVA